MAVRAGAPQLFRRIVISIGDASPTGSGMLVAARFARLFKAELAGLFVEDARLIEWSSVPAMRQLSSDPRAGTRMTPDQLARDFAAAAAIQRERLSKVASKLGLPAAFSVLRGDAASVVLESVGPDDLLVMAEPSEPIARSAYPFREIVRAAARSSVPILYTPHRALERAGPVVALTKSQTHRAEGMAAEIAIASDEQLIVLTTGRGQAGARGAARAARTIERFSPEAIGEALERTQESLIVVARDILVPGVPLFQALSAERRVPTLIVGETRGAD